ncbi:manganese efflux pump MntP family protein [Alkalibacillus flavidus]
MFFYDSVTPYVIMAIAVSMDALSVSLSIGFSQRRLRWWLYFVMLVGLFHVIMPLAGIFFGDMLSEQLGHMAQHIGGWLLVAIGIQMIMATFWQSDRQPPLTAIGLFFLALTVSLDSFSVGISIGMLGVHVFVIALLFGFVSMVFTWFGFMLSKYGRKWLGTYSEAIGGVVLAILGLQMVW